LCTHFAPDSRSTAEPEYLFPESKAAQVTFSLRKATLKTLCMGTLTLVPLKSQAFTTGRLTPARRRDAVLQRYHSKRRRHLGASVSRIPLKVILQSFSPS
jgi:hypothetical protein